jgi:hypothetical protein
VLFVLETASFVLWPDAAACDFAATSDLAATSNLADTSDLANTTYHMLTSPKGR